MNNDGTDIRYLTAASTYNQTLFFDQEWSPDGMHIAFLSTLDNQGMNVYLINIVSKSKVKLTNGLFFLGMEWNPGGEQIAVSGIFNFGDERGFWLLNVKDSTLVKAPIQGSHEWSPDGKYISIRAPFGKKILVTNDDYSDIIQVTPDANDTIIYHANHWSKDSQYIYYFQSKQNISSEKTSKLYRVRKDGSYRKLITEIPEIIWADLSPEGKKFLIVIKSQESIGVEPYDLYIMNADGSDFHKLVNSAGDPDWYIYE